LLNILSSWMLNVLNWLLNVLNWLLDVLGSWLNVSNRLLDVLGSLNWLDKLRNLLLNNRLLLGSWLGLTTNDSVVVSFR